MIDLRGMTAVAVLAIAGCAPAECLPGQMLTVSGTCKNPGDPGGSGGSRSSKVETERGGLVAGKWAPVARAGGAGRTAASVMGGAGNPGDESDGGVSMVATIQRPPLSVPVCGNGIPEPGELCDGAFCPTTCKTGNACVVGELSGDAAACTATCSMREIRECRSGDGCCADGCTHAQDGDCSVKCGDGTLDVGESCDGDCPVSCDDGDPCTRDMLTGTAAACNVMCGHLAQKASKNPDKCCPSGANAAIDPDCETACGDGVVTGDETCDPKSNRPCALDCDDHDPCTADAMTGTQDTCSVVCAHTPIREARGGDWCCPFGATVGTDSDCAPKCGDGVVSAGEKCDGNCPTMCKSDNACMVGTLVGVSMDCSAECAYTTVTVAKSGDGCCPSGANSTTDSDCKPVCGNNVKEAGEGCDGDCPMSCDDGDPCTTDSTVGSGCNIACSHTPVAGGACCHADDECYGLNKLVCVADTTSCDATLSKGVCESNRCTTKQVTDKNGCTDRRVSCGPEYRTGATGSCPSGCGCSTNADCAAGHTCDRATTRCL